MEQDERSKVGGAELCVFSEMLQWCLQPKVQQQQLEILPAHIQLSTMAGVLIPLLCLGMESQERGQRAARCVQINRHQS